MGAVGNSHEIIHVGRKYPPPASVVLLVVAHQLTALCPGTRTFISRETNKCSLAEQKVDSGTLGSLHSGLTKDTRASPEISPGPHRSCSVQSLCPQQGGFQACSVCLSCLWGGGKEAGECVREHIFLIKGLSFARLVSVLCGVTVPHRHTPFQLPPGLLCT